MEATGDEWLEVGAFAVPARARSHTHGPSCIHPLVVPLEQCSDKRMQHDACAASHVLHSVRERMPIFDAKGTQKGPLREAKVAVLGALLHQNIANGQTAGLEAATARVIGVTEEVIKGMRETASRANSEMSDAILEQSASKRIKRNDAFNFKIVYDWMHHNTESGLPDYCPYVEVDKSERTPWKGKKWELHGEEMVLQCTPHVRRATCRDMAAAFLESETHRW